MPYDRNSLDRFVQKQGGSLANLGASPTYTGAPAMRGTPAKQAFQNAAPQAAFQQPQQQQVGMQQPQQQPGFQINPGSLQRVGMPAQVPQGMPQQQGAQPGRFQMNPQQRQRLAMIQQRLQNSSRLPQAGQMMGYRRGY